MSVLIGEPLRADIMARLRETQARMGMRPEIYALPRPAELKAGRPKKARADLTDERNTAIEIVCAVFGGCTPSEVLMRTRSPRVAHVRQAVYAVMAGAGFLQEDIARAFERHHATVYQGLAAMQLRMDADQECLAKYQNALSQFRAAMERD